MSKYILLEIEHFAGGYEREYRKVTAKEITRFKRLFSKMVKNKKGQIEYKSCDFYDDMPETLNFFNKESDGGFFCRFLPGVGFDDEDIYTITKVEIFEKLETVFSHY